MIYKHLTIEEREIIQEMLWQKKSIRAIAKKVKRNPSSISREIVVITSTGQAPKISASLSIQR